MHANVSRPAAAIGLFACIAVCGALRLWLAFNSGMTTDEYATYIFAPDAGLAEYAAVNRFRMPDNLPGYFTAYWTWTQLVGGGLLQGRLLSILCGCITCAILFLITREAFSRNAALLASALYALSPFHIFHDQAIRPYALFTVLAGVSILAVLRIMDNPRARAWFVLSVVANTAMIYTHLLGAILTGVEALALAWVWRNRLPRLVGWGALVALALTPVPALIGIPEQDPRYDPIPLTRLWANFLATDAVHFNVELFPSHANWAFAAWLNPLYTLLAPALGITLGVAAAIALIDPLIERVRSKPPQQSPKRLFLAAAITVPAAIIFIASFIVEPMPLPRYGIYTVFGRLALLAGVATLLPRPALRRAAAGALVLLMAWQLSWMLPAGARTEFNAAARAIQARAQPGDPVYATLYPDTLYIHFVLRGNSDTLAPNPLNLFLPETMQAEPAYALSTFVDTAAQTLETDPGAPHSPRTVYLAVLRLYHHHRIAQLERLLESRGLPFDRTHFHGCEGITLYAIRASDDVIDAEFEPLSLGTFLKDWGIDIVMDGDQARTFHAAFNNRLDQQPAPPKNAAEYECMAYILGSASPELALLVVETGLNRFPNHRPMHFARAVFFELANRRADAAAQWKIAQERAPDSFAAVFGPMLDDLAKGVPGDALTKFVRLQRLAGGAFEPLVGEAIRRATEIP